MRQSQSILTAAAAVACMSVLAPPALGKGDDRGDDHREDTHYKGGDEVVQLGPRPYYLIDDMDKGPLKKRLQACAAESFEHTDFSIGHRGAALQFPEHTEESYLAGARMGAGILECDVTFTKDRELVCRHSQCDLHTTTNILAIPELAAKCTRPFTPYDPETDTPASALCCTSDITLDEFKGLCGKMDASNPMATTVEEYLGGTANWRTDLYATCGTVLSHKESIELFKRLGAKMTPELKSPSVEMPYDGDYTQEDYAQQLIDEYKAARVSPRKVFPQSFNYSDVLYWIEHEPGFGKQAVYLDGRAYGETAEDRVLFPDFDINDPATWEPRGMQKIVDDGVNIVAPPMWVLLTLNTQGDIVPSEYAKAAKAAGLDIITWTLERSGPLADGGGWYHQSITDAIDNDGDTMTVLDVLARDVGIRGIFSDWPATVTFYANCMDLE
jgi:glycerophosphoryl diester phosphodiesterase